MRNFDKFSIPAPASIYLSGKLRTSLENSQSNETFTPAGLPNISTLLNVNGFPVADAQTTAPTTVTSDNRKFPCEYSNPTIVDEADPAPVIVRSPCDTNASCCNDPIEADPNVTLPVQNTASCTVEKRLENAYHACIFASLKSPQFWTIQSRLAGWQRAWMRCSSTGVRWV